MISTHFYCKHPIVSKLTSIKNIKYQFLKRFLTSLEFNIFSTLFYLKRKRTDQNFRQNSAHPSHNLLLENSIAPIFTFDFFLFYRICHHVSRRDHLAPLLKKLIHSNHHCSTASHQRIRLKIETHLEQFCSISNDCSRINIEGLCVRQLLLLDLRIRG